VIRGFKDFVIPEEKVKANKVPTLALIGALDPLKEGVDALNGRMPNLRIVVIDGADHVNAFTRPEFVKSLKEFLAGHKQSEKSKKAQTAPPGGASR
jgi:pimeloyl-ACP methyl ester carboxylesterase